MTSAAIAMLAALGILLALVVVDMAIDGRPKVLARSTTTRRIHGACHQLRRVAKARHNQTPPRARPQLPEPGSHGFTERLYAAFLQLRRGGDA